MKFSFIRKTSLQVQDIWKDGEFSKWLLLPLDQTSFQEFVFKAVKGEGQSKKLPFLSSPTESKHSAFPLTEVSASEVPDEILLERSHFRGRHFETVLVARLCLCDIIPSDSKLAVRRRKTCNWLCIFHNISKMYFSKCLSTSLSSMLSFQSLEHVWVKIIWFKGSNNQEW